MATHRFTIEPVLTVDEYALIDRFCESHSGVEALPELAQFLMRTLSGDIVTDPDIVGGYVADSSNLPGQAIALSRPKTERDCAAVVRACFRAGIPFTVSAGRSNLTGSATPEGGVVISMEKMLSPDIRVDRDARRVTAPVGMFLEPLRQGVLEQSGGELVFPVDPTSRADAQVGGTLACNASGFTPGEVGAMRGWVQSLDILLPCGKKVTAERGQYISEAGRFVVCDDGAEIEWPVPRYVRPAIKNAGGPYSAPDGVMDLVNLMVGSEGLFGIITGCRLSLQPRPTAYLDIFFSLASERQALQVRDCLRDRVEGGLGTLSALEYFGPNSRKYMDHDERLFHGDDPVGVYVQAPLTGISLEDAAERWFELLVEIDCGIDEDAIMLIDNERDRAMFMEARHSMPANSLEVVQRRGTYTIMTDTVVPEDRFAEFLDSVHGLMSSEGMDYLAFGHLGDCHLHFMILPEREQLQRGTELYDLIVAKSAELGGVYSGEHGTGKRKRRDFVRCYGETGVSQVRRAKAAVDPEFLLNRGNVIEHKSDPCTGT